MLRRRRKRQLAPPQQRAQLLWPLVRSGRDVVDAGTTLPGVRSFWRRPAWATSLAGCHRALRCVRWRTAIPGRLA
jgi:hypothetical protein